MSMPLRCLLFSPDEETIRTIGQVLAELGLEAESCFKAVEAVEKVTIRPFQIVIIDWGSQPEAGFLLNTARGRKPADRPLTLAIVSDDASVPTALQAGANSVLRKPLQVNQVRDTLATARDFLRSKAEAPAHAAATAAAANVAANAAAIVAANAEAAAALLPTEVQSTLRAGEFLQPSGSVPGTLFETESEVQKSLDQAAGSEIDPLKDLEPTASSVLKQADTQQKPGAAPDDDSGQPRGLAWYLKSRVSPLPATLPPLEKPETEKPETPLAAEQLLSYEQTSSVIEKSAAPTETEEPEPPPEEPVAPRINSLSAAHQQQEEAELFAYISGEKSDDTEEEKKPSPLRPWLVKGAMAIAAVAVIAVIYMAPQTGVREKLQLTVGSATRAGNSWLNPQPATTPQAPPSHENFGRAGDEYQLPIAENIPDKNTDPSQIRVLPVIDPTVKQPNNGTPPPDQALTPVTPAPPGSVDPADPSRAAAGPLPTGTNQTGTNQTGAAPDGQPQQPQAQQIQGQQTQLRQTQVQRPDDPASLPAGTAAQNLPSESQPAAVTHPATSAAADPFRPDPSTSAHTTPTLPVPRPAVHTTASGPVVPAVHTVSTAIPSSLQSTIAQMSPEASGNKPIEAAMASFEPVDLPEASSRALLLDHAEPAYPPSAHGQTGSVIVQLLIGRDGTVQDAKFVQGSLAFARPAIDTVKQWHFKPYLMNGRPASTKTQFTLNFKPAP
jgi:TonB family protein